MLILMILDVGHVLAVVVRVQLLDEDHDEAEGNCPRGKKPGYGEPFRQDSGSKRVTRIFDGPKWYLVSR